MKIIDKLRNHPGTLRYSYLNLIPQASRAKKKGIQGFINSNTSENGFTLIELVLACFLAVIITGTAGMTLHQINRNNEQNNSYLTTVTQLDAAGNWISQDAQAAEIISTGDLTYPDFIMLSWGENVIEPGTNVQHMVTYYFADLADGTGKLMRHYWNSNGVNQDMLTANFICFDEQDLEKSSTAVYENPRLIVKLRSSAGGRVELKEYSMLRRPDFGY